MTTERSSAVVAKDVSKVFFAGADPVWALEDFSLTLEEGSFTCIVGPSGCGKSTFLRILGGLEERTIGELEMTDSTHPVPAAFVFQEHGVFPWMTVRDNVAFGLRMRGGEGGRAACRERVWGGGGGGEGRSGAGDESMLRQ